jgi:hypothetical protein
LKYAHSNKKRVRNSIFTVLIGIAPLLFFRQNSIKLIYIINLIFSVFLSSFFWSFFIPIFNFSDLTFLKSMYLVIHNHFHSSPTTFHYQSGIFYKDYFLVKNKPVLSSLLIGNSNAVVTIKNKREKRILLKGFHFIKPGEQILHIINLDFHHFYFNPIGQMNTFMQPNSGLDNNNDQLTPDQFSQKVSKNNLNIDPIFSIYLNYRNYHNIKQIKHNLLNISNYFSDQSIPGELNSHVEEIIGESVYSIWKTFIKENCLKGVPSQSENQPHFSEKAEREINEFLSDRSKINRFNLSNIQSPKFLNMGELLRILDFLTIQVFIKEVRIEQ